LNALYAKEIEQNMYFDFFPKKPRVFTPREVGLLLLEIALHCLLFAHAQIMASPVPRDSQVRPARSVPIKFRLFLSGVNFLM